MEKPLRIMTLPSVRGRSWDGRGYICLNDVARLAGRRVCVADWLRNRSTLEHLAAWEKSHNPAFNGGQLALVRDSNKKDGGRRISVGQWIKITNAVGVKALDGRHGGTFAVIDIAMHFTRWVTPMPLYPMRTVPVFRNQVRDVQHAIRVIERYLTSSS